MMGLTREDGVTIVCLDRPPANAFNLELAQWLLDIVREIAADDETRCVLVRSDGRMFSAGADIAMLAAIADGPDPGGQLGTFVEVLQAAFRSIVDLPVPVVSAIRGAATGGGFELALACDFRIAGANAKLGLPEVLIGMLPGAGGTQRMTALLGRAKATELMLLGTLVQGVDAERLGLVHRCVDDAIVEREAMRFARALAAQPRHAVEAIKHCISLVGSDGGFVAEVERSKRLINRPETLGLLRAFVERGRPGHTITD